jgi:hypothetical protein
LEGALRAIEQGHIKISTESDYIRAQSAINVVKYAWILYNANWTVLENDTKLKFITSDNPALFEEQGKHWKGNAPFLRFLSVTPEICIMCDIAEASRNYKDVPPNFDKAPNGRVGGVDISLNHVKRINIRTAMCAEDILISATASEYIRDLAQIYSRFHIESTAIHERSRGGYYIGHQIKTVKTPRR